MGNDDHYIMKLCVGEEIYDIEDFNLQFKRDTNQMGNFHPDIYEWGDTSISERPAQSAGCICSSLYGW